MNKTAKNSIVYLFGTITIGLLGFVNTMLLTRILSQQVYAMYGLLTTFVTMADMFVAFGYDQAYMRFYYSHDRSQKSFLWECLKVPFVIFGLFAILLLEPGQKLIIYIFGDRLAVYVIFAILGQVFFSSLHRFTQLTARMEEHAGNYVLSNIVSKSGFIALLLILSFAIQDIAFVWVTLSFMTMAIVSTGINLMVFRKLKNQKAIDGKPVTNKELLKYGVPYMLNNVIILLIPMIEKVYIRDLAGWEVLSIYTAASIFQTVVLMVVNTLNNIWNPIVYKHCENEALFKPLLHTFGMVGSIITVMGTAACILLRRWLVLLLDENYYTVYIIAPVILLSSCFHILSVVYAVGINIRKKTVHFVVAPILQGAISIVLCKLLIPILGLVGVALAILVSVAANHLYRIFVGLKLYNTGQLEFKSFLLISFSVLAAVCSLFFTNVTNDIISAMILVGASSVIINKDIITIVRSVIVQLRSKKKQ